MQSLKVSEAIKAILQIVINANVSVADLVGTERLAQIQARIGGLRVLRSHPPEGQLDDAGRIEADAQLQQKDFGVLMRLQEIRKKSSERLVLTGSANMEPSWRPTFRRPSRWTARSSLPSCRSWRLASDHAGGGSGGSLGASPTSITTKCALIHRLQGLEGCIGAPEQEAFHA